MSRGDKRSIRLYRKLLGKRPANVNTNRLFLTPNPFWKNGEAVWFKNMPIGKNELSKWTKLAAEKIGLDAKTRKVTNHSKRYVSTSKNY